MKWGTKMKISLLNFQLHRIQKSQIFKGVSITQEAVKDYYGGPKVTKKYSEGQNSINNYRTDTYVSSSQTSSIDYGDYSDLSKNKQKTNPATVLPKSFDKLKESGYRYYQGTIVSQYELVEKAVKNKEITLTEDMNYVQAYNAAEKALIIDKASPKYKWSNTLYSEDGMYVIRLDKNGEFSGMTSTLIDGVHIKDVAARMASGEPNENIETMYLNFLRQVDPELYEAATNIGREVRSFTIMFDLYREGSISEKQFKYDCTLFNYLFTFNEDNVSIKSTVHYFEKIRLSSDWYKLLADYNPEGFNKVDEERQKTLSTFGGII